MLSASRYDVLAAHDVALCSFENLGLDTANTGMAMVYDGPTIKEGTNFTLFGYGDGTNAGGGAWTCDPKGGGVKRSGAFKLAENADEDRIWATSKSAEACSGDSGAPSAVLKGGAYLPFAVHSGKALAGQYEAGTLLGMLQNGRWIQKTGRPTRLA